MSAKEFHRILSDNGIRSLVVGGEAILASGLRTTTEDIDALVLVDDLERAAEQLSKDPAFYFVEPPISGMIGGQVRMDGALVDFDVLDAGLYSGNRSGADFFAYAYRTRHGIYASPQVVWYMRLVNPERQAYALKISRDMNNGAPGSWLEDARKIARRFGTLDKVDLGIGFLKEVRRFHSAH
ncbi:MAG: hypothetical protein WA761_01640 [Thermoplasmata archaeon]